MTDEQKIEFQKKIKTLEQIHEEMKACVTLNPNILDSWFSRLSLLTFPEDDDTHRKVWNLLKTINETRKQFKKH